VRTPDPCIPTLGALMVRKARSFVRSHITKTVCCRRASAVPPGTKRRALAAAGRRPPVAGKIRALPLPHRFPSGFVAVPAFCDGVDTSVRSVERVADGAGYQRRPPWAVGMRSALSPFEIAARLLPAVCSRLIRSIAYWEIVGGASEPDALRALVRKRRPRSLRDQLPLELGEGGEQVRVRFLGRRRLDSAVEGDQRPALLLRGCDQADEVEQHAREPGRASRRRAPGCRRSQGPAAAPRSRDGSRPRPSGRPRRPVEQLPAVALARGRDRASLRLEPGAPAALAGRRSPLYSIDSLPYPRRRHGPASPGRNVDRCAPDGVEVRCGGVDRAKARGDSSSGGNEALVRTGGLRTTILA
jgi:hypothetical protein